MSVMPKLGARPQYTKGGSVSKELANQPQIKLIHVEAGLRSINMAMSKEVNRIPTDKVSNLLHGRFKL